MSYEHLREQLRPKHARVRAVELIAAAVVGVGGVVSLMWLGPFECTRGLRTPAGPLASARVQRVEEPVAWTVLHGSVSGRSEPTLVWVQAMRTDSGRPSFNMRFRTATPTFISVA